MTTQNEDQQQPGDPEAAINKTESPAVVATASDYQEPTSLAKLSELRDAISRLQDQTQKCNERGTLINFLLLRIGVLEHAMLPFARMGMMFSNARLNLEAAGSNDPAGGTWISNPPDGIKLHPTEGQFYNLIDALGRGRTQDYMEQVFVAMREAAKLEAERNQHVEAGGKTH